MRAVVNSNEYLTFNTDLRSHKKAPTNSEPRINPAAETQSIHATREKDNPRNNTKQIYLYLVVKIYILRCHSFAVTYIKSHLHQMFYSLPLNSFEIFPWSF